MSKEKQITWGTLTIAFLGAYIAVEAYFTGRKDGEVLAKESVNLPTDQGENDSPSESHDDEAE